MLGLAGVRIGLLTLFMLLPILEVVDARRKVSMRNRLSASPQDLYSSSCLC